MEFWEKRGHKKIPGSSLMPENDPTTLFTGSGMQPLIPYLLGQSHPSGKRLMDIQKCFRGQDIDEVGDNRHDTFFEMMGNWSLGDYFKKDQLTWYWEFLTKELNFDPKKLSITCFEKDLESAEIWKAIGVAKEKIFFYGAEKNWWSRSGVPEDMPVGEIGGPDSEVFYDFGLPIHDGCHPNCDCGRFLEIGNSVFIQYQKQTDGSLKELPQKNVDFGGGLERTLAALNNDPDIFKTDLYSPIIKSIEGLSGKKYADDKKLFRVVADHLKAAVFLISDGVIPSNKMQGYFLRRLLRRSMIKIKDCNFKKICELIFEIYKNTDYFKNTDKENVYKIITDEQVRFGKTLEQGLKEINKVSPFDLYQTYGFPIEVTEEIYKEKGKTLDKALFEKQLAEHQKLSKSASAGMFKGGLADHSETVTKYHTATHLLQAALRQFLGESVHQEGSNLTAERLRFDFSFARKLTEEELKKITELVNQQIEIGLEQKKKIMSYEKAIKFGALAFFKEKYPEKVTVFSFGNFSKEICGGPHVKNTKVLGKFKIIKEESVSAGVRRIYGQI